MSNSLKSYVNYFTVSANGNLAVTGVGFQPKVVLFITNESNNLNGTNGSLCFGFGYATSSSDRGYSTVVSRAGVTTTVSASYCGEDLCLKPYTNVNALDFDLDFVSMDSDGFTVNVANYNTNAKVGFLALAGDDLQVSCGNFTTSTGTGSQAVTGIGFQPDGILFFGNGLAGTLPQNSQTEARFSMGTETQSGTAGRSIATYSEEGVTESNAVRYAESDVGYSVFTLTGTQLGFQASVTSWGSDGFTWNISTNNLGVAQNVFYIAFKGVNVIGDEISAQQSTGSFSKTGLPFRPKSGIFFSVNRLGNGSLGADNKLSVFFVDQYFSCIGVSAIDRDAQTTTDGGRRFSNEVVYYNMTSETGLDGYATFTQWNSGGFTMNQVDGDTDFGNDIMFLVLGDTQPIFTPIISVIE